MESHKLLWVEKLAFKLMYIIVQTD